MRIKWFVSFSAIILLLVLMAFVFVAVFTGRGGRSLTASDQDVGNAMPEQENAMSGQGNIMSGRGNMEGQEDSVAGQENTLSEKEGSAAEQDNFDGEADPAESLYRGRLPIGNDKNLTLDLNFDGWDDLCLPGQYTGGENMPYYCMVWDQETHQYGQSVLLYNVETDEANQWVISRMKEEKGRYSTTCYRYDENNQLHMVKYMEENLSPDAVFEKLELTYVEDDSIYTLPPIVDETDLHRTVTAMAKQALEELYQWTGEKVDTACFQVSNMGDVFFGVTPEDIRHSRIFYDRGFGADTEYNLSNYELSISSMYVPSGRSVWYSPILWRIFPDQMDGMTDEEIIIWYLERIPLVKDCKVKNVEKRYEDMWTIQTQADVWFEVGYDVSLKEVSMVVGPYPDYPMH